MNIISIDNVKIAGNNVGDNQCNKGSFVFLKVDKNNTLNKLSA